MKNKGLLIVLILTIGLLGVASVAYAESAQTIAVSGTGTIYLDPDMAMIQIGINTEKDNVNAAIDDNADKVKKVKAALVALGVEEKDIVTTNYSMYSNRKYYSDSSVSSEDIVYSVYYNFSIKVRDMAKLNDVLDACIQNGANNLNGVSYDSSKREETYVEARNLAIDNAREKAKNIAAKLGVSLGHIDTFAVRDYPAMDYEMMAGGGRGGVGNGGSAPIESGSLTVSVTVDMSFVFVLK